MEANEFPIAEEFHSIQGEGQYTGTPMHFVRLAGCSVGQISKEGPKLKTGIHAWKCHTYDNRPFWCDTDFSLYEKQTFTQVLENTWEKHICLTGGEPLLHHDKIVQFAALCYKRNIQLHIETSGTIELTNIPHIWMTVSPKLNFLEVMIRRADEIKLLVDKDFKKENVPRVILYHPLVYIQPINEELTINNDNMRLCMELLGSYPSWRLSIQLHKLFDWR